MVYYYLNFFITLKTLKEFLICLHEKKSTFVNFVARLNKKERKKEEPRPSLSGLVRRRRVLLIAGFDYILQRLIQLIRHKFVLATLRVGVYVHCCLHFGMAHALLPNLERRVDFVKDRRVAMTEGF